MGQSRMKGFAAAFAHAGFPVIGGEVLLDSPGFYAGSDGSEPLLARRPDLDVIYFHNDEMAIGGLANCQQRGIRVPKELGIIGWGGMKAASVLPRRLKTTVVPTTQIGKQAAEAMVARLKGEPVQDVTVIATRLVPGETAWRARSGRKHNLRLHRLTAVRGEFEGLLSLCQGQAVGDQRFHVNQVLLHQFYSHREFSVKAE